MAALARQPVERQPEAAEHPNTSPASICNAFWNADGSPSAVLPFNKAYSCWRWCVMAVTEDSLGHSYRRESRKAIRTRSSPWLALLLPPGASLQACPVGNAHKGQRRPFGHAWRISQSSMFCNRAAVLSMGRLQ